MATFLVTARVSIFDEEAGTADQHNLALALPIRDRLLPMRSLHSQLQSISALSLNDPSKGLKSPVKIWGLPTLKYEGLDCRPEATIDYYRPLPSATSCLTAEIRAKYATSYPEDNRSMQVYVRGLSGQQKSIMCTQQMTVEQFKSKVEEAEGRALLYAGTVRPWQLLASACLTTCSLCCIYMLASREHSASSEWVRKNHSLSQAVLQSMTPKFSLSS